MNPAVVIVLLLLVATLSVLSGYLLGRTRSAPRVHELEIARSGAESRAAALEQQLQQNIAVQSTAVRLAAVDQQLATLSQHVAQAERSRAESHALLRSQLHHQAEQNRLATDAVQHEARRLSQALTGTNVRGLWGESELRRLVEAAGMLERVNFDTQSTIGGTDERRRPDMVVHLAGGREIIVDAKVPLTALLADTGNTDGFDAAALQRHAQALRSHIDTLASRNYCELLPQTPELVVLYLPAESLLSLALAADAGLLDHAFGKGIALATPTTLLALLRTVNHGWREEAVAQNAREIHALGAELHKRLTTMSGHFRKLGASLESAVKAYNSTVGSYETRVLPQARKFAELDLVSEPIAPTAAIEHSPRALTVADLDLRAEEGLRAVGE